MSAVTAPAPAASARSAAQPLPPISYKGPIAYVVIALLALIAFGIVPASGKKTGFTVSTATDFFQIDRFDVPSKSTAIVLCLIALALGGLSAWYARNRRKAGVWLPAVYAVALVLALLVWAVAGKSSPLPLTGLLQGALFLAVPLVFGSLAGVLCERSGIINIAIEGQLLAGAFLAAVVATLTQSAYLGLLAAPIAGALVSALLVAFAVKYVVDQIIVGVVLNVLVVGVTSYLFSTVLKVNASTLNTPPRLPTLPIPVLSEIPVLGPVLFRQTALVYIMYVVVIVLQILLFRSKWGLRLRAVGEHPKAADTVGIKVNRTRIRNTLLGGAVAGLGGAFFTVANGLAFNKEMTAGKGYIALAAMILGRWSPKGALAAALLFGFADSLQQAFGIIGTSIPSQLMLMLPYLVTIFAVAGLVGKVRAPASEGIAYVK
ncbi:ABC transporter permease [Cellulomonas taurus]|uniref:ABC transporter permease n=1 Tax=Cellulomonas taurus TaxID=2729175 RepID=UPI00145F8294|nr:ABC transporter permease [Cellulomonas taurus]